MLDREEKLFARERKMLNRAGVCHWRAHIRGALYLESHHSLISASTGYRTQVASTILNVLLKPARLKNCFSLIYIFILLTV